MLVKVSEICDISVRLSLGSESDVRPQRHTFMAPIWPQKRAHMQEVVFHGAIYCNRRPSIVFTKSIQISQTSVQFCEVV